MTTLRIEHAMTDYEIWKKAFDGFTEARANAGVRSSPIRLPVDDPKYLMLDLEFDTAGVAETFAEFLAEHVWSSPTSSPGPAGAPKTRILELVQGAERRGRGAVRGEPTWYAKRIIATRGYSGPGLHANCPPVIRYRACKGSIGAPHDHRATSPPSTESQTA